ncbi:hypothetical protein ACIBIZ_06105 [Nonomuraea spiralis]|uniref:Streptomyces killer toxin-like beta/gamma crystallin domain-containing protein n=1 Tax=Nonomuraea spiralis TaxID=46182 RepID=A0ABV5I807_9ACTN|nr:MULTISPECIES: hypothetical protein [Nonomuraea]RSM95627.1 hypothetical protein DMB42_49680 [Nonomuraea sp. WAC 01424]GGS73635.1 hypothetical protein GCM10010176_015580 [Nonomuraea spiralis]
MLRRGLALLSLAAAALLGVAAPAHAAVVDVPFGPLSIGEYCHAKVSSSSWIGFYESSGLRCYIDGPGGTLQYAGSGDPYLACKYLTTDVVMTALRGQSNALVCRVVR